MIKNRMQIFTGNANPALARKICDYLSLPIGRCQVIRFPDTEIDVKVDDDVRGCDVFIVQSTCPSVNENLMELLVMIDCMKRASAERVTAVIPYYGYARADRKAEGRVPITAKLVANLVTVAGADRVLTVDLHASQIQGFFDIPVDHLFAAPVMIDYMKKLDLGDVIVVSPDVGGTKMARAYAKRLRADLAIVDKRRDGPDKTEVMHLIGDVRGKSVVLVDDMISTGTSITQAARACLQAGAVRAYLCATHAVLSGDALEKIRRSEAAETILTDTIPLRGDRPPSVTVLSVAGLLGEAIRRIHRSESVSSLFV